MSTIETLPAHLPAEWLPGPEDELLHVDETGIRVAGSLS
jgi:hypothetical protein